MLVNPEILPYTLAISRTFEQLAASHMLHGIWCDRYSFVIFLEESLPYNNTERNW